MPDKFDHELLREYWESHRGVTDEADALRNVISEAVEIMFAVELPYGEQLMDKRIDEFVRNTEWATKDSI